MTFGRIHLKVARHFVLLVMIAALLILPSASSVAGQGQANITVCYINTTVKEVPQGATATVLFGVFSPGYAPCGNPIELKARTGQTGPTASFDVEVGSPAIRFTDISVTPTGVPGQYRAQLSWPTDAPVGKVVVFIVANSLYDGATFGPSRNTSYVETPDPTDDSTFASVQAPSTFPTTIVGAIVVLLLALLLLLLFRRRRKAKAASK